MHNKIEFLDLKKITNLHHQEYMQVIDDSWALRAQQIAEKRKEISC